MGNYYYRVEAKGRKLADGNVVHLIHYAYKPSGDWRWNDRMEKLKLGPAYRAWERLPGEAVENVLVTMELCEGGAVYRMNKCGGMLCDAALGEERGHALVGKLRKAGRGWRMVGLEEAKAEAEVMEGILKAKTGFSRMGDLLDAGGRYRPSLDMRDPDLRQLADYYDRQQIERGDPRRAYRYGGA